MEKEKKGEKIMEPSEIDFFEFWEKYVDDNEDWIQYYCDIFKEEKNKEPYLYSGEFNSLTR
jgi:hypothetical protein